MNAIDAIKLNRWFSGRRAVQDVSFSVPEGEVFGLLGPNGAGKTTTIRMLTGQLHPTAGEARVAGCDVVSGRQALKAQIGVVFEHQNLYERMTGGENLVFAARLFGCRRGRIREILEKVGLEDRAKDAIHSYSNGMKQRLLIARALVHRPKILFLDEPTKGLDPTAARQIRDLVRELADQGVTILLTTHYMEEADQLCQRMAFLNEGRIVAIDTPQNFKIAHGERRVRILCKDGSSRTARLDDPEDGKRLGDWAARGEILTVHSAEATLEEVFIRLTGKGLDA
ncbi:MAG: ABC transporter ATP-binding protein [Anaerolineales bacterium]|nr:ABC transporter ATP-binding protein [Anaerolineales bacterium]